jgi:hypothetical protein
VEPLERRLFLSVSSAVAAAGDGAAADKGGADCDDAIVVADFDSDGKADVLLARNVGEGNTDDTILSLYRGGGGTVTTRPLVIPHVLDVRAADVNGDGRLDIIAPRDAASGLPTGKRDAASGLPTGKRTSFAVLLNRGNGDFAPAPGKVWGDPHVDERLAGIGDFDGDGKADLLLQRDLNDAGPQGGQAQYRVLLGNGDGSFEQRKAFVLPHVLEKAGIGDFNGDGRDDIAWRVLAPRDIATGQASGLAFTLSDGTGGFAPAGSVSLPAVQSIHVGDLDGDGRADIIAISPAGHAGGGGGGGGVLVTVINYDRKAGFVTRGAASLPSGFPTDRLSLADVNGDGSVDVLGFAINEQGVHIAVAGIAIKEQGVRLTDLGSDDAGIAIKEQGVHVCDVAVGDVNGDGTADLVGLASDGSLHVALNLTDPKGGSIIFADFKAIG